MFKCIFCGLENPSETARFCVECGPDGPAKDWKPEYIDQPEKVTQYISMLSETYFNPKTEAAIDKYSLRMRERLKISHDTHSDVIAKLAAQKKAIAHLANFRIEFNENVTDAYAGHDTYLSFRYTNLSEDDLFKISLLWDDPGTTDRVDFRAQTSSLVEPQGAALLGGSVIFDRMGIKELPDMLITITDQFGECANFKAESFGFKVGNHDQKIIHNISTHNQISIEGRGVVDASGLGADNTSAQPSTNNQPRWRELGFRYVPDTHELTPVANAHNANANANARLGDSTDEKISQAAASTTELEELFNLAKSYANGSGVIQDVKKATVLFTEAALKGHALSQSWLGVSYALGIGVEVDLILASMYLHLSAENGCAHGQHSLGMFYATGTFGNQDFHLARYWLEKAAEQGYKLAADELAKLPSADQISALIDAKKYWSEREKRQEEGNKKINEMASPPPYDAACPCGSGLQYKSCHAKLAKRKK